MSPAAELLVGLVILVGLFGIAVPLIPGAWLVLAAVLVWALELQSATAWLVLAVAAAAVAITQVVRFTLPERRLRGAGVARRSVTFGGVLGVVGFFVVPVLGLPLGFVLGIYLAERRRLGDRSSARRSTRAALSAVGLSVLIELSGGLVAAAAWVLAVVTS